MGPGEVRQGSIPLSDVIPEGQAPPRSGSIPLSDVIPENPDLVAATMVGPDGAKQQVVPSNVASMRQKNFALAPDSPNAQKMVTVDGKVAYVLPGEVKNFEDLGGTHILPDGRFNIKNLRSDNTEFPDSVPDVRTRAVNVIKALGPEETHKAIQAEKAYWTSKEGLKDEAKGLANVGIVGGGTLAAIAAPGPAIQGVRAAFAPSVIPVSAAAPFGGVGPSMATTVATWVGKQLLKKALTPQGAGSIGGTLYLIDKLRNWWK